MVLNHLRILRKMKKFTLQEILGNSSTITREFQTATHVGDRDDISDFVVQEFKKRTSNEKLIEDIFFISGELANNSNEYANNYNSSKKITVSCLWKSPEEFYFVVKDEGKGFDVANSKRFGGDPMGGCGIYWSKQRSNILYNFNDAAVYVGKKI